MRPSTPRTVAAALAVLALGLAGPGSAEKKPALSLESVRVEPASPAPDTLCRLSVTVRSSGELPASALQLAVKLDGRDLAAYKDRVYLEPVEPGQARELRLFNFWSTEAGRPAPAGGKLTVEVTLTAATWMRRETRDGAEVWTPAGPVEGLPVARTVAVKLRKPP